NGEFYAAHQYLHVNHSVPCAVSPLLFNWLPGGGAQSGCSDSREGHDLVCLQPYPIAVCERVGTESAFWLVVGGSYDVEGGVVLSVEYRTDIFTPTTMDRFGQNVRLFCEEFARDPHVSV